MTKALPKSAQKVGGLTLTKHLRLLAAQIDVVGQSGTLVSKAQRLGEILWERALGYQEKTADGKLLQHKPEQWAVALIYDRLEGRVPVSIDDKTGKTLADKVTELGKARINALAETEAKHDDVPTPSSGVSDDPSDDSTSGDTDDSVE